MNFFISEAAKNILAEHALIIGNTSLAENQRKMLRRMISIGMKIN